MHWISERPFAASLQGVHNRINSEEDRDHLSRKSSIMEARTSSLGRPLIPSLSTHVPAAWASQSPITPIMESPLLPPPPNRTGFLDQPDSPIPHAIPTRSPTVISACSSQYSDHSSLSRYTRSHRRYSSLSTVGSAASNLSRKSSVRNPRIVRYPITRTDAPKLPDNYRHIVNHCNGGTPMRPISRPRMPPGAFWKYVAEQQRRRSREVPGTLQSWQLASDRQGFQASMHPSAVVLEKAISYEGLGRPLLESHHRNISVQDGKKRRMYDKEDREHIRHNKLVKKRLQARQERPDHKPDCCDAFSGAPGRFF